MSTKQIYSTLQQYLNKGYTLCPDTSFLMNASELLANHTNENIVISQSVYNELDKMKDAPDNASSNEMRWAKEARDAFTLLDNAKAKVIDEGPAEIFVTYNLTDQRDDQIVADYLYRRDKEKEKVILLTLDADVQFIAESAGLPLANFDIKKFHNKRRRELKVYTTEEIVRGKKINPIHRFFRRVYLLIRNINEIGTYIVYGVISLVFIIAIIAGVVKAIVG